jgi:predicted nucleotidyltransferase
MIEKLEVKELQNVIENHPSVLFAYLYGSAVKEKKFNDIDIAVFLKPDSNPFFISADLKILLSEKTGINPDLFDIQVINNLVTHGDILSLPYLKHVFETGILIIDKDEHLRTSFIEDYGMKYRECESLILEVLA